MAARPRQRLSMSLPQHFLVDEILQHPKYIAGDDVARRVELAGEFVDDRIDIAPTVDQAQNRHRLCSSGSISRSGASTIHALRRSSKRKRTCGANWMTAL